MRSNLVHRNYFLQAIAVIVCFIDLCGCTLFIPTVKEEVPRASGYQLNVPNHWKRINRSQGDQAYELPSGSLVTITSSCTRNSEAPLDVLTKHLLIGSRNVAIDKRERWRVDSTDGLHSQVRATFEGKPFHLEIFVLPKSGCVFDFSLISRSPISAHDSNEFRTFIKSFQYEKSR